MALNKINGIAATSISKVDGVAKASINKVNSVEFILAEFTLQTTATPENFTLTLGTCSNLLIDWGDTNQNTYSTSGNKTHSYATLGTYTLKIISGTTTRLSFGVYTPTLMRSVVKPISASLGLTSAENMFYGCTGITSWAPNFFDAAIVNITNLTQTFYNLTTFNENISGWNVAKLTTTYWCFNNCSSFNQDVSGWNVANVTDFEGMFKGCAAFNQDLSSWNVAKATQMGIMFGGCIIFNADISGWDVSKVINMSQMFINCYAFNANISGWNVAKVAGMSQMFQACRAFNQDISGWNVGLITSMDYMFYGAQAFNANIGSWNVSNVTSMVRTFEDAYAFNQNIGSWNVSKVTNMYAMFSSCYNFNQNLSSWDVDQVTDFTYMFSSCVSFKQDLSAWLPTHTSAVYPNMFANMDLNNPGTPANLDALYNSLATNITANSKTLSGGLARYSYAGTSTDNSTGRAHLTATHSWTVTDGGDAGCTFSDDGSGKLLSTYASTQDRPTYARIRFLTSNTLPTGLSTGTDYWTIRVSSTTCKLATSLANAQAGTAISYTDAGTGNHVGIATGMVFTADSFGGKLRLTITTGGNLNFSGRKIRVVSTTTLPTGLSAGTDYWLNLVSATTYKVTAVSAASASLGTAGDLIGYTDAGSGTHELLLQPYP